MKKMHKKKIDHKLMKSIKEAHKEKHHKHHESKKHEKHEPKKHEHKKEEHKKHEKHEHKKEAKHKMPKGKGKVSKVMHEFKEHKLHSGSKKGPEVTNPKQALAIGYSEARRAKKKKK